MCTFVFSIKDEAPTLDAPYVTCINYGSMMRSFDGRSYNLKMNCRYILAMDSADNWQDTQNTWSVEAQSVSCDTVNTCKKVRTQLITLLFIEFRSLLPQKVVYSPVKNKTFHIHITVLPSSCVYCFREVKCMLIETVDWTYF